MTGATDSQGRGAEAFRLAAPCRHRIRMIGAAALLLGLGAMALAGQGGAPGAVLAGDWQLNRARSHYGPGVERRRDERMTCTAQGNRIQCRIRSTRTDGRELAARFSALLDGPAAQVVGIPDVDAVRLHRGTGTYLDATFFWRTHPVFGYRAFRSADGRSLMIVAVDPVTRVAATSVVVYDRR